MKEQVGKTRPGNPKEEAVTVNKPCMAGILPLLSVMASLYQVTDAGGRAPFTRHSRRSECPASTSTTPPSPTPAMLMLDGDTGARAGKEGG